MRYLLALLMCLPAAALEVTTDLDGGTYNETLVVTEPGVTISNVTVEGTASNPLSDSCIKIRADNVIVTNCTLRHSEWFGVSGGSAKPDGVVVSGNDISFVNNGVWAEGTNWLVEGNDIYRIVSYGRDANGIIFFGDGHTFRLNYIHGSLPSELGSAHYDGIQTWPQNFDGNGYSDILIEQNIIQGTHQMIMGHPDDADWQNVVIRDNVLLPYAPGEELDANRIGPYFFETTGAILERNTIIRTTLTGAILRRMTGLDVTNNVLYECESSFNLGESTSVTLKSNVLYQSPTPSHFEFVAEIESSAIKDDPMLVDPSQIPKDWAEAFGPNAGWRLRTDSPYYGTHGAQIPVLGEPEPEPEPTDDLWHTGVTIAGPDGRMYELVGKPKGE